MDAIDGKQARRTGMASALGEMFDHGCDAINTSVSVNAGVTASLTPARGDPLRTRPWTQPLVVDGRFAGRVPV